MRKTGFRDTFYIETLNWDKETESYQWETYSQTPIFEQASAIMKHKAENGEKARMWFYIGSKNAEHDEYETMYFFNY